MVIIRRNPDGTIANPDMVKQQTQQQKHKTHNTTKTPTYAKRSTP